MPIPITEKPNFAAAASKSGISSRQGAHQVAQKLKSATLPCHSLSWRIRPERSGKEAESSFPAPVADWMASAPTSAPAASAAAPAPPRISASRRSIAKQRGELGDAGALHDAAGLGALQGQPLVAR